MSTPIKAIETHYKGYRFRSRLEARWAVFFDTLGIKWEYEPEGVVLPDGTRYLPDFRVTTPQGLTVWYEVKPEGVTTDPKFTVFADAIARQNDAIEVAWFNDRTPGYKEEYAQLLSGDPVTFLSSFGAHGGVCPRCGIINPSFEEGIDRDVDKVFVGCRACDITTPCGGGHPEEAGVTVPSKSHKGLQWVEISNWNIHLNLVQSAAVIARSARFEHGQSGGAS